MTRESRIDRLLEDSERLRGDLLKMVTRLQVFSEELRMSVDELDQAISEGESGDAGTGTQRRPPRAAH